MHCLQVERESFFRHKAEFTVWEGTLVAVVDMGAEMMIVLMLTVKLCITVCREERTQT